MSHIEFLIDPNNISLKPVDIELSKAKYDPQTVSAIREKIQQHLLNDELPPLVIRADEAWFKKFNDFRGLKGVTVTPISSVVELGYQLKCEIPSWCNNELIKNYGLLDLARSSKESNQEPLADIRIFNLLSPELIVSETFDQMLHNIWLIRKNINPFVSSSEIISNFIRTVLTKDITSPLHPLIFDILRSENSNTELHELFQQGFFEKLRILSTSFKIDISLPARSFDKKLIDQIKTSKYWWSDIKSEPYLSKLTTLLIEKLKRSVYQPECLSELIFYYSEKQFNIIHDAIIATPFIATHKLLANVESLGDPRAESLVSLLRIQVESPEPIPFNKNWKAKEAIEWGYEYTQYAKTKFNRDSEPSPNLTADFEEWLYSEPTRVSVPPYGWREVSNHVRKKLEEKKRVVLIIVDALGSILTKELIDILDKELGNTISVKEAHLFAPTPTLTEIGKIAVTTGQVKYKLPSNSEVAIRSSYETFISDPNELQIIKSWNGDMHLINSQTKLLIYFENQLDDMLHECISYSDLTKQLDIVCKKVSKFISYIFDKNNVFHEDTEVIISADHGLTRIAKYDANSIYKNLGKISDRHIKADIGAIATEDFWEIKPDGASDQDRYFVKKGRNRLLGGSKPFVHGGLLPEEVLIPFIQIKSNKVTNDTAINVELSIPEAVTLSPDGWILNLHLDVFQTGLDMFTIEALLPFKSQKLQDTNISAKSKRIYTLKISSEIEQSGKINLELKVVYRFSDKSHIQKNYEFELELPEHNIIRDKNSQDFNDMFN